MSTGTLRGSLVSRLIVVSRKPHGVKSRVSERMSLALPTPSEEEVSVAIELLSLHPWPKPYVWQAVQSLASSNCLHMATPHHLTRLYQLVGKDTEREGMTADGSRVQLNCLSSLIPALSNYASLHPVTEKALHQVIAGQAGLSPGCEQSILSVLGDDPAGLTHLMKLARSRGHHFSRGYYRQALGKVMEQQNDRPSPVVRDLLQMMSGDMSKAEVEADMFWVALHLARDPTQVQAIIRDIQTSSLQLDEGLSLQLMNASLRTSLDHDQPHTNTNTTNPSHAVSALVDCLLPQNAAVSATAFERVLTACADTRQLTQAVVTFMCMTQVHGLAPTRTGLGSLIRLLCHPLLTANHTLRKLRLGVCYHALAATVQAFAGEPPPWVYVECARPFTELLGRRGYNLMHNLCQAAVHKERGEKRRQAVLAELWSKDHYHRLMEACHVNHGLELGTFLLQEMIQKGISPDEDTVSLLLQFKGDCFNIDDYIVEIVRCMKGLTPGQVEVLQQPLYSALNRTLSHAMPERMRRPLVSNAVEQLLLAGSESWSNEECTRHLASLCRTDLWCSDRVVDGMSVASSNTVHVKRATA